MIYGSGRYPEKFTCTIRPRSKPVEQLVVEKLLCNQPDLGGGNVARFRITLLYPGGAHDIPPSLKEVPTEDT
jgi:hypothetical protein